MKVRLTFTENILGTLPQNEEVYTDFIASKAPDAGTLEDEVAALGVDEVVEKGKTVFPKEDGVPFLYDYQIKGFFKGACGFLRDIPGTESNKLKSYKKKIDGLIFVYPRKIVFENYQPMGICQRPLRAQTMQGERVSLAISEEIPAGASIVCEIDCLNPAYESAVREWLDFGKRSGIGQWRNSGKGRFDWEEITE